MNHSLHAVLLYFGLFAAILPAVGGPGHSALSADTLDSTFDVVIRNGRVMDPDRRVDSVMNVGITGKTIRAITSERLRGRAEIDATGLVVSPGFIDLLSYDPVEPGTGTKIMDGVTTALAMHGGTSDPDRWYAAFAKAPPLLNFGASFFYSQARLRFVKDRYLHANGQARQKLLEVAEQALRRGALGVSFALEYVPGITAEEVLPLMSLAVTYNVPVFFHARYSDMEEPGTNLDGLREIIGYARATHAAVHIDHINSTGGTFSMLKSLAMLDSARATGLDITACIYPYTFWATYLNSARFDEGWQTRFRISYGDLQLGASSDRLTRESFLKNRRLGKLAVAYAIPEEDTRAALRAQYVMIGSDAILEPGFNNHPRASGTFARTIAVYARDQKIISLMDALAKMTILPARRMERAAAAMERKGRLQVGADADIVVFDAERIRDRATVEHPETPSTGIHYVLVGGKVVLDGAGLHKHLPSGTAIRGRIHANR